MKPIYRNHLSFSLFLEIRNCFLVSFLLFCFFTPQNFSFVKAQEEDCDNAVDESHPIEDQRESGAFSSTVGASCENPEAGFLISDSDLYFRLAYAEKRQFCNALLNSGGPQAKDDLCTEDGRFAFTKYPEHMEDFIEQTKVIFSEISLNSIQKAQIREMGVSEEWFKSMMYLCTYHWIEPFLKILKSPDSKESEKLLAIDQIENRSLLYFLDSQDIIKELLVSENISKAFKKKLAKKLLSVRTYPVYTAVPLLDYLFEMKDLDGLRSGAETQSMHAIEEAIQEFFSEVGNNIHPVTLQAFQENNFEIPDSIDISVIARKGVQGGPGARSQPMLTLESSGNDSSSGNQLENSAGDSRILENLNPLPATSIEDLKVTSIEDVTTSLPENAPRAILEKRPQCENVGDFNQEKRFFIAPEFEKFISNNETTSVEKQNSQLLTYYLSGFGTDDLWKRFEEQLLIKGVNSGVDYLSPARMFYCHLKELAEDYNTFMEDESENKTNKAKELFNRLTQVESGKDAIYMFEGLLPHLAGDDEIRAIEILGSNTLDRTDPDLERWRLNILSRHLHGITSNGTKFNDPAIPLIIEAMAKNGRKMAERTLADIFRNHNHPTIRNRIIQEYRNASLLASQGKNLEIIKVISELPTEKRNPYYLMLGKVLDSLDFYRGNTAQGASGTGDNQAHLLQFQEVVSTIREVTGDPNFYSTSELRNIDGLKVDRGDKKPIVTGSGGGSANPRFVSSSGSSFGDTQTSIIQKKKIINDARGGDPKFDPFPTLLARKSPQAPFSSSPLNNKDKNSISDPERQILGNDQSDFFSGLVNTFNPPEKNPAGAFSSPRSIAPLVGERKQSNQDNSQFTASSPASSLASSLRRPSNSPFEREDSPQKEDKTANKTSGVTDSELLKEIKDISNDKDRLSQKIDEITADNQPSQRGVQNSTANQAPSNSLGDNRVTQADTSQRNQGRGPVSVNNNAGASSASTPSRGPASVSHPIEENPNRERGIVGASQILSPYDSELNKEDNNKIIKVKDELQRKLLMNYMAAKETLSCPELRFIEDFYQVHVDKFILTKKQKPYSPYAILDIDGMNFRFNYPGVKAVREEIDVSCREFAEEKGEVGENERAPASDTEVDSVNKEALPAKEETGLVKKFLLKLGL